MYPELSGQEARTAERIVEELEDIGGFRIRREVAGFGIIADMPENAKGKETQGMAGIGTVALRADMDALPIQEETGLAFASRVPGVMHACGHDHHIAILLGAARLLAQYRDSLPVAVRLLFQPAEEMSPVGGARGMIENGALEGVDAVFGLHVWPSLPAGVTASRPSFQMASSDRFSLDFQGKSAHAAMPHLGKDALMAGCHFVSGAQTIISRNTDPMQAGVLTIGLFRAGDRYNIVPGNCRLEGTVRSFSPLVRDMAEARLRSLFEGTRLSYDLEGTLDYQRGYDAVENDPAMSAYVLREARELFGEDFAIEPDLPAMTAEDFAFYLKEKPGAFFWLGTGKPGVEAFPLHSPRFAGNEEVLWRGSALMASLALDFGSDGLLCA